jgi:hypothetical protein
VLSTLLFVIALETTGRPDVGALTLWFCIAGVISLRVSEAKNLLRDALHWWNWFALLLCVVFYASSVYGHILPKYGGGAPTPIVVYLNKPLPWAPSKVKSASLLDETEQGYFVAGSKGDNALFVPRSNLFAIYFGLSSEAPKAK